MSDLTQNVGVAVDPNTKPVRGHENGLPVSKRMKTPVLCQNRGNTYRFVPEDIAREKIAEGLLVEIHPWDDDFIKGTKLAIGKWEGFAPGELVQIGGQPVRAEDLGKFDADKILDLAEKQVKEWAKNKEAGILSAKELPPNLATFEGKAARQRFAPTK